MGAQISAYVRLRLSSSTLEDLLSDDKFVEDLEQKLAGLENKSQKNLAKLLKRCQSPNSSEKKGSNDAATRLRPLWEIQPEDVAIPSEIADAFEKWKLDHLAFLQREFSSGLRVPLSPGEHYHYTRNVQASLASDRVLRRYLTTVYYDLVSEHSQSDRNSITKVGVEFVAAVICNAGSYNNETVKKDVGSWAKEGGKFRGLADAMDGLGCYFFLPAKLSEWIWLKYLTQEHHERATTLLRKHGIIEKAKEQGAQGLAIKIERSLRAPFEEAISLTVQVRQRIVPVTAMALAQGVDALPGRSQISTNPSLPPAGPLQSLTSSPSPGDHLQTSGTCPPASSSYSPVVHASSSLEISPRPSEARRWSGNTNTHGPEQPILGHDQAEPNNSRDNVDEIEVMDIDNTPSSRALDSFSGSNSNAIPRLAANGLIKMQWPAAVRVPCLENLEYELFDFYVNCICAGRTVLRDNAYLNEFLPILHSNGRTINPVLALSASYLKEYFVEGNIIRKQIEYAEYRYSMETAQEVREAITRGDVSASTAVAAALLSHHATLNPSLHPCCWTKYLYPMLDPAGAEIEANLAMASVAILAMTALPLNGKNFQRINYSWIGCGEAKQLTKVNSTLGLSRMMLYFIYSITQAAKDPNERTAERLLREIEESPQWVDETEDSMPRYIALGTAETYRFGTQLYCLARLYGYTPEHPAVKQICDSLLGWLYKLPTEGPWYSSIHPAWCFVMGCICAQADEDYTTLVNYLDCIAGNNKSVSFSLKRWYMNAVDISENVDDVCSLVRRTRHWQRQEWENRDGQDLDPGWWERMAENVDGEFVICLA